MKIKQPEEWMKQAEYDFNTADALLKSRRYMYVVFMCHFCIEKALKGILAKVSKENPPRSHNLLFLVSKIQEKTEFEIEENLFGTIKILNTLSVPTRYPENLYDILKDFKLKQTKLLLSQTKELLKWLKEKL